MHDTAMQFGEMFFKTYAENAKNLVVIDIGSQDVNGSLKSVVPENNEYIGVDFVHGKGVDVVLDDPYTLPFEDNSVDIVLSSSCLEHSEFFWLLFLEMMRILKPSGLLYLNVPSNGNVHRYPVDCWRFYPDSAVALANWAQRNGYSTTLLESFVGQQRKDVWNDFVGIFVKDKEHAESYPARIQDTFTRYTNGLKLEDTENLSRYSALQEDQRGNIFNRIKKMFL